MTISADLQGVLGTQDEASAGQQELIARRELIERRERIVELLVQAYWMEIETVMNYLAASVNPDGVRALEVARALEAEVADELSHARQFAERIKELYGVVPGSLAFTPSQTSMQPADEQTDVVHIIHGVIEAETGAIAHYSQIIDETDGVDYPTQDMVIGILREEERHRRLFEGFLREYAPPADA